MVRPVTSLFRRAAKPGLSLAMLGAAAPAMLLAAPPARASCEDILPVSKIGGQQLREPRETQPSRLVRADDILRLRDIGLSDTSLFSQDSPLAISPDGRRLAFVLNRGDPDSNSYCRALVVIRLDGPSDRPPDSQALDRGGDLITITASQRGALWHSGFPALVTPAWSPDGRWIAFLRRDHGVTQLWRVRGDAGPGEAPPAQAVTQLPVDVERFVWSRDGRRLIYVATPSLIAAEQAIDREGRQGWLNDALMVTNFTARPLPPGSLPREAFAIDPESRIIRAATGAEQELLDAGRDSLPSTRSSDGRHAWTRHGSDNPASPLRLMVEDGEGRAIPCNAQDCTGFIYKLWWDQDGRSLILLRREGWDKGQMGLLRWRPGDRAFHRILLTNDVLQGCLPHGAELICTAENAVTPRHLVAVDLRNGRQTMLYDPNPDFAHLRLGTVTRLTWTNDIGLPSWGDLVLPPDYRPGTKLPMIITQYHSDGFLRGATGDEYPIHAFAARGFAVLSLERPPFFGSDHAGIHTTRELAIAGIRDWNERRSLLSSLVTGVRAALARGDIDPARIGITGLSDGASTTRFALVNTRLFAAAAISTCCTDTNAMMNAGGIAFADAQRAMGYPASIDHDDAFWAPYSMTLSAKRMDRPMLMQLADREMNLGLETFMALREAGQPVEMYVYPDEYHNKWQPAHRQAIYERNLDWFDFWLRDKVDPDPAKAAQYARWNAMKAKRKAASAG